MQKNIEFIAKRHHLVIETYPFYKCLCGYVATILITKNGIYEEVTHEPEKPIEYLDCGHAVCCQKKDWQNKLWCTHCAVEQE